MKIHEPMTNIVVTCWNAIEHTRLTLQSLFDTVHHDFLLTIVDNGSVDGTCDYLKNLRIPSNCKKLTVILNKDNIGAGAAINQGQEVSNQNNLPYTCLCNNDLYFQDNWLLYLEEAMNKNLQIGILGALRPAVDTLHHTRNESAKQIVDATPKNYSIIEELNHFQDGYTFEETAKMIVSRNGRGINILRCPPNAVITCCALIRNSVSEKIGLFSDPQFEIYGSEDIDLSWRLQKAGYICAVLKDVYVHHFRHRSITASNLNRDKYLLENNIKLFKKWKNELFSFLKQEEKNGVDIVKNLTTEENHEYFFLRRIKEKINFMLEYTDQNHG